MTDDGQSEIFAFLSSPATFGVATIQRIDTHISAVFLAGELVYKAKRAVRLPFLDFTSLEARRRFCEAELAVNRRTAPTLYRGLAAVTREADGRLAIDGAGPPVEWLVVMARFAQEDLFDRLAAAGRLDRPLLQALIEQVVALHEKAERCPGFGGAEGLRRTLEGNMASFAKAPAGYFDEAGLARLKALTAARIEALAPLLDQRRAQGKVRRCHGDLHLGNICLFEGRPTLFDAIEFNDDFQAIDTLYDLAFLVMDLDAAGLKELACLAFNRYLERTGDLAGVPAMPLFLSLRAAIRAHVAAARPDATARQAEGRAYLARALSCLETRPAELIAIGGLSGSGKSRLSRQLAPFIGAAPGAVVLRSDVLRKGLMGKAPEERLPPEGYDEAMTRRTYGLMAEQARMVLGGGQAVIADAVFARPEQREAIEAVAAGLGLAFRGLWLEADPDAMRERISTRVNNASDATPEVLERQLAYDLGPIGWTRLAAGGAREATLANARSVLRL